MKSSRIFKSSSRSWKTGTCPLKCRVVPRFPGRLSMVVSQLRSTIRRTTHSSKIFLKPSKRWYQKSRAKSSRMISKLKSSSRPLSLRTRRFQGHLLRRIGTGTWRRGPWSSIASYSSLSQSIHLCRCYPAPSPRKVGFHPWTRVTSPMLTV